MSTIGFGDEETRSMQLMSRLSSYIDYTLLRAEATSAEVHQVCADAVRVRCAAVCVNGVWVELAERLVRESAVRVATVVAFPLGASSATAKASETRGAIDAGADEIDVVVSLGHALVGDSEYIVDEITGVVDAARGKLVKAILETAALTDEQIKSVARAAVRGGVGMVKTSTGFHVKGGATIEAVSLLRSVVGDGVGVKASGGIRTAAVARAMIGAGATRIGTSTLLA